MSNVNFEEYRQPWETGPHWELKREFMEKYQNDFPEDRLLCLAQAYSNIELLHCSYPDPVMLQIHELSKSLHGCKRFREANKLKEGNSSQRARKGKRNLPIDDSNKSIKFIKFCSANSDHHDNKTGQLYINSSNVIGSHEWAEIVPNSPSSLNIKPIFDHVPDINSDPGNKTYNSSNVIDTHHTAKPLGNSQSSKNKISNPIPAPDSISDNLGNDPLNSLDVINTDRTDVNCKSIEDSTDFVLHLTNSPDFKEIKAFADEIKSNHKSLKPHEEIEIAASNLNLENLKSFKFCSSSIEKKPVCSCAFYIGNTLVSIGRDSNVRNAFINASAYAVEILSNLDNLPCKTLSDLKMYWFGKNVDFHLQHKDCCRKKTSNINSVEESSSCSVVGNEEINEKEKYLDESSLHSWLKLAQEVKKRVGKYPLASEILESATKSIDNSKMFHFNFNEELNTPLNSRIFCCSLVVKKTLVCEGKDSSKKKAKTKASENGVICLLNLIKWYEEHIEYFQEFGESLSSLNSQQPTENFKTDPSSKYSEAKESILHNTNLCDISSSSEINQSDESPLFKTFAELRNDVISGRKKVKKIINQKLEGLVKNDVEILPKTCDNVLTSSSESKEGTNENILTKPFIFTLNKKLLHNSYSKQLVVFDTSAINSENQQSPAALLNYSASFCQKQMTYDTDEILSASGITEKYRFRLRFDGEVIGIGEALTKIEAKAMAAFDALGNLRKSVYTIKVKNELEDGFVINRSQVIDVNFSSNVVSDNNIGRKMLKMMGWSGGGIGKKEGITEPIVASDHQFHQGLGFSNNSGNMRNFKQKIDALLKDFSQSNTTGDLIFATDFSKDERKDIHRIAVKYNLHSNSRGGKNKPRQLFIRRKMSVKELLNLIVQAGGCTSKYELVDCSVE